MVSARVSNRGQTCIPADLRHRWGLDAGGAVAFVDLGNAALLIPGDLGDARAELRRVLASRFEAGISAITDPDLLDQ